MGIETLDAAQKLFLDQAIWERTNNDTYVSLRSQNRMEYQKSCVKSETEIISVMRKKLLSQYQEFDQLNGNLKTFSQDMHRAMAEKKSVDLLDLALKATKGDRIAAVRMIALFGHDEINTSMRIIRKDLIIQKEFKRLANAGDAYTTERQAFEKEDERFKHEQFGEVKSGNMTLFKDLLRSGSTLGGENVKGRYYHFVAGLVVSCELRAKNYGAYRSESAAELTGKVYEAFDFKDHIKSGVALKDSIENYKEDTSKHTIGGKLGASFCP